MYYSAYNILVHIISAMFNTPLAHAHVMCGDAENRLLVDVNCE